MFNRALKTFLTLFTMYVLSLVGILVYLFITAHLNVAFCSSYEDAIGPAREALYIQSGVKSKVDEFNRQVEREAKERGLGVPFGLLGIIYRTYKTRTIEVRNFKSPIIEGTRHTLTVRQTEFSLNTQWRF